MGTLMSLVVSIGADIGDFQKSLKSAEKDMGGFAKKMEQTGKSMMKIGGTMTAGLTVPLAAFFKSSIDAAIGQENALAELDAVIASTGGSAGVTRQELEKMANELQKVTKFEDDAILSGQSMLLTFTKIGKDVFPEATIAMLNMAEKFGSIEQASIQLGKALNDPIAGVAALRRVGIQLTEQQEESIKAFMEVGDIASAQRIILGELETQFGGLAEAAGQTTAGQFAQFKNQLGDMTEIIGVALIPVLLRLMEALIPLIEKFSNASPEMQNFIIAALAIAAVAGPVITAVGGIVSGIGALMPVLTTVFGFITATAIPAIFAFIAANIAWLGPLLLIIATVYLVYLAFKNNFGGIRTTVEQLWFIIKWANDQIMASIARLIIRIGELAASFLRIKLPKALTPGSPTPFEMGLRGINSAMDTLATKKLPDLQTGLNLIPNVGGVGGSGGNTTEKTINIKIENPKNETTEESIKKTLQNLSYLGIAA